MHENRLPLTQLTADPPPVEHNADALDAPALFGADQGGPAEAQSPDAATEPPSSRPVRSRIRRLLVGVLVVACLVAGGAAWVAVRGLSARDHLVRAAALVQQLRQQVQSGDKAATATLAALQRETEAARADTGDPVWRSGTSLPKVGDELAAVRTVAAALDDLARHGLPPLVQAAGGVDIGALAPKNGRVDLAPLRRAAPALAAADHAIREARERIAAIPMTGLMEPVRSAVIDLNADLARAAAITATGARSAALLPAMLGDGRTRTYLVLFQNPTEIRATGGMPGAYVVMRAQRGRVTIIDEGASARWGVLDRPILPVRDGDRDLYGDKIATFPANVNLSPHFPTAAALARAMYQRHSGRTVDGVLATDPITLSYLLRAAGQVRVPNGPDLTARNAVSELLSRTYARTKDFTDQDAYFGAAARATFEALMSRKLDPARLLAELARAAGERRILVWSARSQENEQLAGTVLAGVMPTEDGSRPTVGVFLNDGSGAKLGYYLRQSAELSVVPGCPANGRRELRLRVTLSSRAPKSGLPPYVLGLGLRRAVDPYTVRTHVVIYSPTRGGIIDMQLDGGEKPFATTWDRGRTAAMVTVDLKPGASRTVDARLITAELPPGSVQPQLWTTPAVTSWHKSVQTGDACPVGR